MKKIDYPESFAKSKERAIMLWPSAKSAVINPSITFEDYCAEPENWFAQAVDGNRHKYSEQEMRSLWGCVESARKKMMAFYLVDCGKANCLNDGLAMVA